MMDYSVLTEDQRTLIEGVIGQCDYPFDFPVRWEVGDTNGAGAASYRTGRIVVNAGTLALEAAANLGRALVHELGHQVNYQRLSDADRRAISLIMHGFKPLCEKCLSDWDGSWTKQWNSQPDENFCELFVLATSPFAPYAMSHDLTETKAMQLRSYLGLPPVSRLRPPTGLSIRFTKTGQSGDTSYATVKAQVEAATKQEIQELLDRGFIGKVAK